MDHLKDEDRMLKIDEVLYLTGRKMSRLYKMIRNGEFPRPCKDGKASYWKLSTVREWIAAQG